MKYIVHIIAVLVTVVGVMLFGTTEAEALVHQEVAKEQQQVAPQQAATAADKQQEVQAKIHFINTGQSDCILVESDGEFMLIDGGDKDDDATVKAYLQKVGVKQLKYVIATHFHADHLGGLDTIVKDFGAEYVFVPNGDADTAVYREFIQACTNRNLKPSVPLSDVVFELGKSTFRVLNAKGGYTNINNNSLVVELTSGNTKALFTGDIEKEVEQAILSELSDIDILKVAHHGSSSSTTDAFLNQVTPEVAVIQSGIDNKYGHPHIETMQKLKAKGITVHRNDECGDIVYTITQSGYTTNCQVAGSYNNGGSNTETTTQNTNTTAVAPKPTETTQQSTSTPKGEVVYITNTGSKYHREGCRHLKSKIETTLEKAKAQGLEPCGTCMK